ncbi:hypothetical protein M0812_25240 [Anaeramoeba flamelloides]|uniref:Uncharacterized protein n=1 Tax=Anaeramoeba flamelloides TaxID=1746091 RepID=A0AAV7YJH0_9EUKA|nr:hypothetical protein M0812_25240 [Anaeramoeba flamelloides]
MTNFFKNTLLHPIEEKVPVSSNYDIALVIKKVQDFDICGFDFQLNLPCWKFHEIEQEDMIVIKRDKIQWKRGFYANITIQEDGLYQIFFLNCVEKTSISFKMDIDLHLNGNYLSSTKKQFPLIYLALLILYCLLLLFSWILLKKRVLPRFLIVPNLFLFFLLSVKLTNLFIKTLYYLQLRKSEPSDVLNILFYSILP